MSWLECTTGCHPERRSVSSRAQRGIAILPIEGPLPGRSRSFACRLRVTIAYLTRSGPRRDGLRERTDRADAIRRPAALANARDDHVEVQLRRSRTAVNPPQR